VLLVGPPVEALREWLERADIGRGRSFQAIDRREAVEGRALMLQSASWIVKQGCAGREAEGVSALGLRDRYLTGAAREGIGLPEAMQQPQHRSVQQATGYYTEAERAQGRGGSLV
jgi:integrase